MCSTGCVRHTFQIVTGTSTTTVTTVLVYVTSVVPPPFSLFIAIDLKKINVATLHTKKEVVLLLYIYLENTVLPKRLH
jgi:hypothetical protein